MSDQLHPLLVMNQVAYEEINLFGTLSNVLYYFEMSTGTFNALSKMERSKIAPANQVALPDAKTEYLNIIYLPEKTFMGYFLGSFYVAIVKNDSLPRGKTILRRKVKTS